MEGDRHGRRWAWKEMGMEGDGHGYAQEWYKKPLCSGKGGIRKLPHLCKVMHSRDLDCFTNEHNCVLQIFNSTYVKISASVKFGVLFLSS